MPLSKKFHIFNQQRQRRQAKEVAYIVLILGELDMVDVIEPVRAIRSRYQALVHKEPWDYAVIGQANTTLSALGDALQK